MKRRPPALGPLEWIRHPGGSLIFIVFLAWLLVAGILIGRLVGDLTGVLFDHLFGN